MKRRKHMKKTYCLILAVAIALGVMLCSCKTQDEPMPSEPESESASQPTEPTNESITPTEAPTDLPTEPPTEAPTEPEPPKLAINYDLLDDIGLSCTELEKKHGEIISYNSPHGGRGYIYENGYGIYCFYEEPFTKRYYDDPDICPKIYNNLWYDENGYYVPITDEECKCRGIDRIDIRDVLLGAPDTVSIAEIEELDGVTIDYEAQESRPGDSYAFCSSFTVDGYENYFIVFEHDDPEMIDLNSYHATILPTPNP